MFWTLFQELENILSTKLNLLYLINVSNKYAFIINVYQISLNYIISFTYVNSNYNAEYKN